ncbi:tegument protein UL14 [Spheniscid alphaherpesvirus 1]|uniref:Tegument protein UL14 n=1 Tax=Spheniscid alphaherpesvirus 1 TaxID=2560777 RepID=A0A1R3TFN9_9ALPH|nr:tegument protein UL14 [Spheniscid alphaherpesvirus 1]SCO83583.1 tegument protein UL14 [Spheniscid alphaherpesvirus 1]
MDRLSRKVRERRIRLEEAHVRQSIYRARTLDLIRAGVDKNDPEFVQAFTSAKNAHVAYCSQLRSNMRVDQIEQKARAVRSKVEEQAAVKEILDNHRRYLQPDFVERLDDIDYNLSNRESELDAVVDTITDGGVTLGETEWLGEDDELLLTKWKLAEAPPRNLTRQSVENLALIPQTTAKVHHSSLSGPQTSLTHRRVNDADQPVGEYWEDDGIPPESTSHSLEMGIPTMNGPVYPHVR